MAPPALALQLVMLPRFIVIHCITHLLWHFVCFEGGAFLAVLHSFLDVVEDIIIYWFF